MEQHIIKQFFNTIESRLPYDFSHGFTLAEGLLRTIQPGDNTFSTQVTNGIYTNYPHGGIVDALFEISFQRILRNEHASAHYLGLGQKLCGATLLFWPLSYSPEVMIRRLRSRKDLLAIMEKSSQPYSLLCEQVTTHIDNYTCRLFKRKPLLIVLGISSTDLRTIVAWEEQNTTTAKEGLFGPRRISKRSHERQISTSSF